MSMKTYYWEKRLLEQAYEAFESPKASEPVEVEDHLLERHTLIVNR